MKITIRAYRGDRVILTLRRELRSYQLPAEELGNEIAERLYKRLYGSLYSCANGSYKLALSYDPFGYCPHDMAELRITITDNEEKPIII